MKRVSYMHEAVLLSHAAKLKREPEICLLTCVVKNEIGPWIAGACQLMGNSSETSS